MKNFESTAKIQRPVNEVYRFLADMNNHKDLMPENVIDWKSTSDEATFSIKNMAKLSVKIGSRVENEEIKIVPVTKPPFDVELKWTLAPAGTGTSAGFTISAELNMMMKMMASGPLQKLADEETQRLAALLNIQTN
jgi:carbon monoxide dehydrogenase subunit G